MEINASLQITTYHSLIQSLTVQEQLEIFSWVLNRHVDIGEVITSPFRYDRTPGCWIRQYGTLLLFTDFKSPYFSKYTALHSLDFFLQRGLNYAARFAEYYLFFKKKPLLTLNTVQSGGVKKGSGSKSEIFFVPHKHQGRATWTQEDMRYWALRGVSSEMLEKYNCYSVHHFYLNGKLIYPETYPCYAYVFPETGRMKIYQPFSSRENKWFSTTTRNDVWKFNEGNDRCIITKSFKDGIMLASILPDVEVHALQNETCISEDTDYTRFTKGISIVYDADCAGVIGAYKLLDNLQYKHCRVLFYKEAKDTEEVYLKYGVEPIIRTLCLPTYNGISFDLKNLSPIQ